MNDLILSSISLEQFKTEISQSLKQELENHFRTVTTPKPETELITRKQAASMLGVSLPTLLDWTKTGRVIGYRIATRVRYKKSELETSLTQIKHGR